MKILHLSDIHLSEDNYKELQYNYFEELKKYLKEYNHKIDLLIITGDLVDRGGLSLIDIPENTKKHKNPFFIFEELYLNPLKSILNISNKDIVFVPGNHDVDESEMLWIHEKELKEKEINKEEFEKILKSNEDGITHYNKRIKYFKEFEKKYHNETIVNGNYFFTNNQSTYIYNYTLNNISNKIGIILINDSWRCSSCNISTIKKIRKKNEIEIEKLFFGVQQIDKSLLILKNVDTKVNFLLSHHPFEKLEEKDIFENKLINKNIDFNFLGDIHEVGNYNLEKPNGKCLGFGCRKSMPNYNEKDKEKYDSGFQIFEFDFNNSLLKFIHYVIYRDNGFSADTQTCKTNGIYPINRSFIKQNTENHLIEKQDI